KREPGPRRQVAVQDGSGPLQLLKNPHCVRVERLADSTVQPIEVLPSTAIGPTRHVGERIQAVLRAQEHFVDRAIARVLTYLVKVVRGAEVAVGRRKEFGRIALERMSAELLNVHRDRRGETLEVERVRRHRSAEPVAQWWQTVLFAGLAARDGSIRVEDGGGWATKDGDAGTRVCRGRCASPPGQQRAGQIKAGA